MQVLVIGGAGYIGSHVVATLLAAGHEVEVYDNLSTGQTINYFPQATNIEGDILNYPLLKQRMKNKQAVIHLAAFKAVGESMINPSKYSLNNITGTLNIINAMIETGVKFMVFSSSAAIFAEPETLLINEDAPKNPASYYGFTKLEIERFLGWYDQLKGLKSASLRYFNAAGYDPDLRVKGLERNPANLIPLIMESAFGMRPELTIFGNDYPTPDGTCVRDYIHVNDLARAHLLALEHIVKNNISLQLNLGTGKGLSVQEVYEGACRVHGQTIPMRVVGRRAGDAAQLVADPHRAQQLLGWKATQSDLKTLLSSTYKAYQHDLKR
jgi:UDP-glucose 4-epimerase